MGSHVTCLDNSHALVSFSIYTIMANVVFQQMLEGVHPSSVKDSVQDMVSQLLSSQYDPRALYVNLRYLQEVIKGSLEDPRVKELMFERVGKRYDYCDTVTTVVEGGVRYDYASTGDSIIAGLYKDMSDVREAIRERERFLVNVPAEGVQLDGQFVKAPAKVSGAPTLRVDLPK